jgi:ribulose kinase
MHSGNNSREKPSKQDTVFPAWWMNEGGQSASGQLIDFVLTTHPAYGTAKGLAESKKISIHQGGEHPPHPSLVN